MSRYIVMMENFNNYEMQRNREIVILLGCMMNQRGHVLIKARWQLHTVLESSNYIRKFGLDLFEVVMFFTFALLRKLQIF